MWMKWPPRNEVLFRARKEVRGKRHKYEYKCAKCKRWFPRKLVEVDHIKEVGTLRDYSDLPTFVQRLLPSVDGLQIVCKKCHQKKTNRARKSTI